MRLPLRSANVLMPAPECTQSWAVATSMSLTRKTLPCPRAGKFESTAPVATTSRLPPTMAWKTSRPVLNWRISSSRPCLSNEPRSIPVQICPSTAIVCRCPTRSLVLAWAIAGAARPLIAAAIVVVRNVRRCMLCVSLRLLLDSNSCVGSCGGALLPYQKPRADTAQDGIHDQRDKPDTDDADIDHVEQEVRGRILDHGAKAALRGDQLGRNQRCPCDAERNTQRRQDMG